MVFFMEQVVVLLFSIVASHTAAVYSFFNSGLHLCKHTQDLATIFHGFSLAERVAHDYTIISSLPGFEA